MTTRRFFAEELVVRLDAMLFASPSHRALNHAATLLEPLTRAQQDLVLQWTRVVALTDAEMAHQVCSLAAQVFDEVGDQGFLAWVKDGMSELDAHGPKVARRHLAQVDAFVARFTGCGGVQFAEIEHPFGLLLHALGGAEMQLKVGDCAWTDTQTIYLPAQIDSAETAIANRMRYKATAVMLWAQVHYGTYAEDLEPQLNLWADRTKALSWLAAIEAVRHEKRLALELPGLAKQIAAVRGPWPEELQDAVRQLDAAATMSDSLRLLDEVRASNNSPPKLAYLGMLDPQAVMEVRIARLQSVRETQRAASNTLRGIGGVGQGNENFAPLQSSLSSGDGDVVGTAGEPEQPTAQNAELPSDEAPSGNAPTAGEGGWQPGPDTELELSATDTATPDYLYDEWDYHRQSYRRQWCRLYEHESERDDQTFVTELQRRHAPQIRRIRRRFEALRGQDRVTRCQPDGDEIDLDSYVDALADRRVGAELSSRLFCRRQRTERSLAVMFMVDMSGSTKGWVNDAEREALVMLCEAFETLNDRYAIYGFSGWGRTQCDIYRIKTFAEPYSEAVRARISGIAAKDYTRMGVAVRHLSSLLVAQEARHKLLVTLSDGRPDDFGDEYRGHYGIEDTRRALQEARYAGIRPYCVTIDRHGADYLKRLYGEASYSVLADVTKLPLKLAEVYRKLTS